MYGYYDPYIIYGWCERNRENVLDSIWFGEDSLIRIFSTDVVRNYAGEAAYGVPCVLNPKTGELTISETNKKEIEYYYNKLIQFYIDSKKTAPFPELGYYNVLSGDIEWCQHYEYNPEEDLLSQSSDDEYDYGNEDNEMFSIDEK